MPVEAGLLPPRYRGPQLIARGGMGEIYRATDDTLGRAVAVKLLAERYSQDDDVRERFTREALAAARLSGDANTVTIFDVGEWNGRPFIVMEYLPGGSLEELLAREGAQPPGRALAWLEQAARALDAAHGHGVVHRDVKPANLLLDRKGDVHVADFGIASAAGLDSFTRPGTVLGTAGYLAPEQALGERATSASDRYALAVVAWELLTGSRPFAADSPTAEATAHANAPVPPISRRGSGLPPELDSVFERALAKDPERRYRSCAEVVADIRGALDAAAGTTRIAPAPPAATAATRRAPPARAEPPRARPPVVGPPPGDEPPRRRRTLWPLLLGLAVLALLGGGLLAAALAGGDGDGEGDASPGEAPQTAPTTVVTTIVTTAPGTTQQVTVTQEAPPPPAPPPAPPASPPPPPQTGGGGGGTLAEGRALTDESTGLIRNGNYSDALPVAQRALEILQGSGDIYEAYANYNVGKSLLGVGNCADALPYFDRSEQIQGQRKEIDQDRKAAEKC